MRLETRGGEKGPDGAGASRCPFAKLHLRRGKLRFPSAKAKLPRSSPVLFAVALALGTLSLTLLGFVEGLSRKSVQHSLTGVLQSTQRALDTWVETEKSSVEVWAGDPRVVETAKALLTQDPSPEALQQNPAQRELRQHLGLLVEREYLGFFIIGPGNISLASARDSNVGTVNLLIQEPERLERMWRGETVIFPPQYSDVPLNLGEGKRDISMFVGAPVKNKQGEVIALLTFRVDPYRHFLPIIQTAQVGDTGETYVFGKNGDILSKTMFESSDASAELWPSAGHEVSVSQVEASGERSGAPGFGNFEDYRGTPVYGAWAWHRDLGLGYTTKIDAAEAYALFGTVRGVWLTLTAVAIGLMCLLHVIQKRLTRQMDSVRAHLQAVVDNAVEGIISINTRGEIETWNPGAEEVFGYSKAEILGENVECLMPEPYQSHHDGCLTDYLKGGEKKVIGKTRVLEGRRKDGSLFPLELSVSEMRTANERKFVGTVRDITERENHEKELTEALNAAELANNAKSVFLAKMSHEIRTPMNAILGFSKLMQLDAYTSEKQQENIQAINRSGEHLLHLINDILEMSKIGDGGTALSEEVFSLHQLTEDLKKFFRASAKERGVNFDAEIAPEIPERVVGDKARLSQVLMNLIGNALKFTQEGKVRLRISGDEPGAETLWTYTFEVEDTGIGIEEEDQERVFVAFEQAGEERLREGSTGLGLAVSQELVTKMGGEIHVESTPGEGSIFGFSIPLKSAEGSASSASPKSVRSAKLCAKDWGASALVVDDQRANRLLMTKLLSSVGFQTLEAENGLEALRACQRSMPRVVLMDRHMPEVDGLEATRRIKATKEGASTPIICVSASAFDEDVNAALEAGCCDFVAKPIEFADLLSAIALHAHLSLERPEFETGSEAEDPADPEELKLLNLPESIQKRLGKLARDCDSDGLAQVCDEIDAIDSFAADRIRGYAREFRFDLVRRELAA